MEEITETPSWKLYERLVAAHSAENLGIDFSVTPNAIIVGSISQISRQIDALIDARWGDDLSRRTIVDAKLYKRKVDIKDIESFEGMMKDCRAEYGIIVCPKGWTAGAKRRAQEAITVKLITLEQLESETSWASFGRCMRKAEMACKGVVLWESQHAIIVDRRCAIVYTGICDSCHNFHVWCWDCGETFSLQDEDEYTCYCDREWVTVIEEDVETSNGNRLNAVHLILSGSNPLSLARRMLR